MPINQKIFGVGECFSVNTKINDEPKYDDTSADPLQEKGPSLIYVSIFLPIFDQLSTLVSTFDKYSLFTKLAFR